MPEITIRDPRTKKTITIHVGEGQAPPSPDQIKAIADRAFGTGVTAPVPASEPAIDRGFGTGGTPTALLLGAPDGGLTGVPNDLLFGKTPQAQDTSLFQKRQEQPRRRERPSIFSSEVRAEADTGSVLDRPYTGPMPDYPSLSPAELLANPLIAGAADTMTAAEAATLLPRLVATEQFQGPEAARLFLENLKSERPEIFGRAFGRELVPTAGGLAGALRGARAGAMATKNPWGAVGGGILGGFGGGMLLDRLQEEYLSRALSDETVAGLDRLRRGDRTADPVADVTGSLAAQALFMRPPSVGELAAGGRFAGSLFRKGGTAKTLASMGEEAFGRAAAELGGNVAGAALPVGMEAWQQYREGNGWDWRRLAMQGAGGLFLSAPNRAGAALGEVGPGVLFPRRGATEMADTPPLPLPEVGTVRFDKDGKPAEVVAVRPDGRLRVQFDGRAIITTPEQFAALSNPRPVSRRPIESIADLEPAFREQFGFSEQDAARSAREWELAFQEEARRSGRPVDDILKERVETIQYGGELLARELLAKHGYTPQEIADAAAAGNLPTANVEFNTKNARSVVSALSNPKPESGVHELGHIVRRMLDPVEQDLVAEYSGAERDANGEWRYGEPAEEKFANAWQAVRQAEMGRDAAYERVSPIFQKVANLFRSIVNRVQDALPALRRVKGVDGQVINPDIVKLIDARAGGRSGSVQKAGKAETGADTPVADNAVGRGVGSEVRPEARSAPDSGADAGGVGRRGSRVRGSRSVRGTPEAGRGAAAGAVEWVDPDSVDVLPGMQFKRELADTKNNVTDQLKNQRDYDVTEGGVLTVWEDRSGRRFAVDGHHRRELAQRAERFVRPTPDGGVTEAPRAIAVQVFKEADGWTADQAKAWGVRRNLREGKARAIDAADALVTLSPVNEARAELARLPKSALVRDTTGLIELDAAGREQVANRRVSESVAAGIGKALSGDPARQKIALDLAAERRDISTYEDGLSLGREVASEDVVSGDVKQLALDGLDVPEVRSTAAERTILKKAAVNFAVEQQRKAKGGLGLELLPGETINREQREQIAAQIGETRGGVSEKVGAAFEFDPSVKEALRAAAVDLAEGKATKAEATQRVWDAVLPSARRPLAEIVSGKPSVEVSPEPAKDTSPYAMEGDDAPDTETISLFHGAPPKRRKEVLAELERTPFVPTARVAEALGDRPEYLDGIMQFMARQREKAVRGEMTARDVAKAYVTTVASQGARAMRYEVLKAKLKAEEIDFEIPDQFRGRSATGAEIVRPEDAAAAWLGSPTGQRALDAIERGDFDSDAWNQLFAVRRAFGDDWFGRVGVAGVPGGGRANLRQLGSVVEAINAAKGDPEKVRAAVSTLNGIGPAKDAFIAHMLGFGESPTADARQVNIWLTGKGSIKGDKSEGAQASRLFRQSRSDQAVSRYMAERVRANIAALRAEVPGMADVPEEAAGAILHQWMWDRMQGRGQAGKEPLHDHAGLYEALSLFHGAPKVGDSFKHQDGRRFEIEALDAKAGTARIGIYDKDGKKTGVVRAAPIQRFIEERQAARVQFAKDLAVDVANAPRSLQSSFDLSAPLRQGAILSVSEPAIAARATAEMFSALKTANYDALVTNLEARSKAGGYEDAGLYLASQQGQGKLGQGEETFLSRLAGKLPHVRISEQAYVAYLDRLRADVFDKWAGEIKGQKLGADDEAKALKDAARFINAATGRGELLPALENSAGLLNGLLFSPRFVASRFQVMNPVEYARMSAPVRKKAVASMLKFAVFQAGVLGLLKAAGAEVELNPRSPDFLKAKFGDWRYDFGGGETQVIRAVWRTINGFYKVARGQKLDRGEDAATVAGSFLRSKLSPAASYTYEWASGKKFGGEKFEPLTGAGERLLPLIAKDLWEAWQTEGAMGGLKLAPGLFGVGVQRYKPKPKRATGDGLSSLM